MMKKALAVLLVLVLALSILSGCGSPAVQEDTSAPAPAATEEKPQSTGGQESEAAPADTEEPAELDEIDFYLCVWGQYTGFKEVAEEFSRITEEKANVKVNFHDFFLAEYGTALPLAMASGDPVDLIMLGLGTAGFTSMTSQNMLLPLNDLLPEYAPELMDIMEPYLPAQSINGTVYAVPCLRMYNTSQWLLYRQDILEALGLYDEAMAVDSWSSLEALLIKVRDAQPDLPEELKTPVIFGQQAGNGGVVTNSGTDFSADKFAENKTFEYFGSSTYMGVDSSTNTVFCNATSDSTKALYDRMYKWNQEGLISKDAAFSTDYSDNLMAAGQCFCYMSNGEYGCAEAKTNNTGRPICGIEVVNFGINTSYVASGGFAVASTTEYPEASVAVMNQLFTNPDLMNLLVWGIRGRDYELNEEGEAYRLETSEYQGLEYFYGNQFNAYPSVGQGGNFRQLQWENNKSGKLSPYFGMVIDATELSNELTAIQNVIDKYYPSLASGSVATDKEWENYKKDLDAAGMPLVIEFYQKAVDEWVASNK